MVFEAREEGSVPRKRREKGGREAGEGETGPGG